MVVVAVETELEEAIGRIATAAPHIDPHIRLLHPTLPFDLQIDGGFIGEDHPALKNPCLHVSGSVKL